MIDESGMRYDLDLGSDHWLAFTRWAPDRELNPKYAHLPDDDKIGGIIRHKKPDGKWCEGSIFFDKQVVREVFPGKPMWTVESWEPLTCSPSFLCQCGDHGFIKQGKWVSA